MTTKTTDEKTLSLIKEITRRKAEIAKAEKPSWRTNCSFTYDGQPNSSINLQVESSVKTLISIAAYIGIRHDTYKLAIANLELLEYPEFTYNGYSVEDWFADIKSRINKIQISTKKKQLEILESRATAIISPEMRAELELQAIMNELGE